MNLRSEYNGHCCDSRIDSKVLKDIKSDVAALQTQMDSVNSIIDSTNAIIESMSAILIPSLRSREWPYIL